MLRKFLIPLLCACACVVQAGCTPVRTKLAYTVYPIGYILQRITGDNNALVSVQDESAPVCVQRAQASTDFDTVLERSEVLFHIGTLEPYLAVHQQDISASSVNDVDLSSLNAVYDLKRYIPYVNEKGEDDFKEEPFYEGKIFENIDMTEKDLSLWNDPITMLSMSRAVRNWIIKNDPSHTDTYEKNYEQLEEDLINLDAQYQMLSTQLSDEGKRIAFVSVTPSYGSWQKAYGFEVYPLMLSRFGVLPDEDQIQAMEAAIKADQVEYIVHETNLSMDMENLYQRVQKDLNLKEIGFSDLSSLSISQKADGKDYLSIMYENLAALENMQTDDMKTGTNIQNDPE